MTRERQQTLLLARTFFSRMFESELMPAGLSQVRAVISILSFLAAPAFVLPLLLLKKYLRIGPPEALQQAMAHDRTMALLLSMTATAFITLVIWENIFPDRRDCRSLGVLPVRGRTFVVARLSAIAALFSLLFLLTNAISSIGFGVLASMARMPDGFLVVAASHFLSVAAAEGFVFFGILTVQCALVNVAGPTTAHRLAVVLQMALIVAVLQMPLMFPPAGGFALDVSGTPGWAHTAAASLLAPLWFLSLYQWLAGHAYEGTAHLTLAAALLGTMTPVVALAFYGGSYGRLTRLAIEGRPVPRRLRGGRMRRLVSSLSEVVAPLPPGAAVCAFTLRTLVRSRQHRMVLSLWIGVALALTISAALPAVVRGGWHAFEGPRGPFLVGPLIVAALVQTGMRSLFAIPVEIRANWTFRSSEPLRLADALSGCAAALIVCGVFPPAVFAFASASWLWGFTAGLQHAIFCTLLALVLVQVLTRGIDRVPFTCIYTPGTAHVGKLWPLYLTVFSTFTYGMATMEAGLLGRPRAFGAAVAAFAVVAAALWRLRLRETRQLPGLRFDEEPADVLTLSLSS